MRLRTELLCGGHRSRRPQGWPRGRRCRWTEEGRQVAPAIQLELARPHPDRCDTGHGAKTSSTLLAGDAQLPRDLETVIDLQEKPERAKVVPTETLWIDLSNLREAAKAFLDLFRVPVLNGEPIDVDEGEPGRHTEEAICGVLRLQKMQQGPPKADGLKQVERVPGLRRLTVQDHAPHGRLQQVDGLQRGNGPKRVADERANFERGTGGSMKAKKGGQRAPRGPGRPRRRRGAGVPRARK